MNDMAISTDVVEMKPKNTPVTNDQCVQQHQPSDSYRDWAAQVNTEVADELIEFLCWHDGLSIDEARLNVKDDGYAAWQSGRLFGRIELWDYIRAWVALVVMLASLIGFLWLVWMLWRFAT